MKTKTPDSRFLTTLVQLYVMPPESVDLIDKGANSKIVSAPSTRSVPIIFDNRAPPFNDVRVRQALNYAVDKESLNRNFFNGRAMIQVATAHPSTFGHNSELKPYPYEPEKAKELLGQAGFPNGFDVELHHPSGRWLKDVLISGVLGVASGIAAGFYGGFVDEALMRLADLRLALPFILLVIAVIAVFGPGFFNVIVILGLTGWVPYARVVRAEVLSIREREFVIAARVLGARDSRLMFRHILPNIVASAIVIGSLELAQMIVTESALSFPGLGVRPPTPSWGNMLGEGRDYLLTSWWLATFPGLAITVTAVSVNLVGDWLRDVLDPRLKM